jgi:hypothetical protein
MRVENGILNIDGLPSDIRHIFKIDYTEYDPENMSEYSDESDDSESSNYSDLPKGIRNCDDNCKEICMCGYIDFLRRKYEPIEYAKEILIDKLKKNQKEVTRLLLCETSNQIPYQYHFNFIIMYHFRNLKQLFIEFSHNLLSQLNACFKQLNCLETLIMIHAAVITYDKSARDVDLSFPQTLKYLKLDSCRNYKAPIYVQESMYNEEAYLDRGSPLNVIPKALPSLKKLVYNADGKDAAIIHKFIDLNPQLNYIASEKSNFTAHTLHVISSIPTLKVKFDTTFDDPELDKIF